MTIEKPQFDASGKKMKQKLGEKKVPPILLMHSPLDSYLRKYDGKTSKEIRKLNKKLYERLRKSGVLNRLKTPFTIEDTSNLVKEYSYAEQYAYGVFARARYEFLLTGSKLKAFKSALEFMNQVQEAIEEERHTVHKLVSDYFNDEEETLRPDLDKLMTIPIVQSDEVSDDIQGFIGKYNVQVAKKVNRFGS